MARTSVTTAWAGEEYSDPIVIPIVMTIPDPRQMHKIGMSRLRRAVVMPANGWPSSDLINQRQPGASEAFNQGCPGNNDSLQNGLASKPKDFVHIQFDGEGKQPLGPKATEALEELRGRAEGRDNLAKSGAFRPTKEEVVGLRERFGQDAEGARDLICRPESGPIELPKSVSRETLDNDKFVVNNELENIMKIRF
jgi:hypothetical protein